MGLQDVARRAGVSMATVSRFLRDRQSVSAESRQKIERALEGLGYAYRRQRRRKGSRIIVIFIPDMENPFFAGIAKNMNLFLFRAGYMLLPCNVWENDDLENQYVRFLSKYPVEGIVLISSGKKMETFLRRLLDRHSLPIVFLDRRVDVSQLPFIGCDNREAGKMATQHLLQMGRRNIAFIAGKEGVSTSVERLQGYKEALEERGPGFREELVIKGDFSFQSGFEAGKKVLAMKEKIDGVFAANDFMALGCMDYLKRAEVAIPKDISVVGCDDIWAGRIYEPSLTTVRQPVSEMCELAANTLVHFIQEGKMNSFERIFRPELIVRESSVVYLEGGDK